MWQLYQDAMAIVRSCGKPDLFITMTCNPNWPEITAKLLLGQTARDRPELVSRVFKLKLNELLDDLIKKKVCGRTVAHIYVIEYQKRGLPHAHILIILAPEDKRYPKTFCDETLSEVDGYPIYRRWDDGVKVYKNGHIFTNAHVVPHNPYLSAKYNCHINVEIATTITVVKYLFKYVYKGHDRASITMVNHQGSDPVDEISEFQDTRYVSAAECSWRIFGFRMHQHSPSVTRLQLHLPHMQTVRFDPETETAIDIVEREDVHKTTLTAFSNTCRTQPELTRDLLYPDFPTKFTWDPKSKTWNLRKNKHMTIGRVTFCPPSAGERYYIRMLLYTVKGPSSFEALRRYNGEVCHPIFR